MAKRFTDTALWNKEWYQELSLKSKCLIRYLFDNCDTAGVWTPNWKLASFQIGETVTKLDLSAIPGCQYEVLPNGKIFLPDFIPFQCGTLSRLSPAHKPIFLSLEKNSLLDRVLNRLSNSQQEKEKEIDISINTNSNGENWDEAKRNFMEDSAFQMTFCVSHNMRPEELLKRMKSFTADLEMKEDYKNKAEIKRHFVNWFNKNGKKEFSQKGGMVI